MKAIRANPYSRLFLLVNLRDSISVQDATTESYVDSQSHGWKPPITMFAEDHTSMMRRMSGYSEMVVVDQLTFGTMMAADRVLHMGIHPLLVIVFLKLTCYCYIIL